MPFETFDRRWRPLPDKPTVTIQRAGAISFNRAAYELLGEPDAVELLFDRDAQCVAVRAADPSLNHTYPLQSAAKKERQTFVISGKAFIKYYGLDTSKSIRREATVYDGMVVVDLADKGIEVTSNRNKRKANQADGQENASEDSPSAAPGRG